jgi:hypothetical protein
MIKDNFKNLHTLMEYFPSGTGEEERELLREVFIKPSKFDDIIYDNINRLKIIIGSKGVGKSALLGKIDEIAATQKIPTLLLKPDDITDTELEKAHDTANQKRLLFDKLVNTIGSKLGSTISGLLFRREDIQLFNTAIKEGKKHKDTVQRLLGALSLLVKPQTGVDFESLSKVLSTNENANSLAQAIAEYLTRSKESFILCIDDTDQIVDLGNNGSLNRIWSLILACRKLTLECKNIKIYITLRTEIWNRINREDTAQRDQIDHIRSMTLDLTADEALLRQIFNERINRASQKLGLRETLENFFDGRTLTLPTSTDVRDWETFLVKSSRDRPRDLIQLIHALAKDGIQNELILINSKITESTVEFFSKDRAEDLSKEFHSECGQLLEIIRIFATHPLRSPFEDLRSFLKTIPSSLSIQIRGKIINPDDDSSALELLQFLHDTGFINPRTKDLSMPRGFRHIIVGQDPRLVKRERWNELQKFEWEIHPVFHSYLKFLWRERMNFGNFK